MISILILISCTTVVFGAPTRFIVIYERESILHNLTSEAQSEYYDILFDHKLRQLSTLAEIDETYDKWAEKHGISDKWTAYIGKHLAREEKFNETALSVIENLPVVYRMYSEIMENRNQTLREFINALEKLYEQFHLEGTLMSYLGKLMIKNEEALMNGNICSVEMRNSTIYLTVENQFELILKNLTSEAQLEYYQILVNDELTLAEMEEKMEKWAKKYGISEKYTALTERWIARKEKLNNKIILSVVENLPSVYRMYSEITTNRNQTSHVMKDSIDKLKKTYCLELTFISDIKRIVFENYDGEEEKRNRNRGKIETGNEVYRKMRDFPKNGNFKALIFPGPF